MPTRMEMFIYWGFAAPHCCGFGGHSTGFSAENLSKGVLWDRSAWSLQQRLLHNYSCRSSVRASTSAPFHRNSLRRLGVGLKCVSEVSYRTMSWSLFPEEGSCLPQWPLWDRCVAIVRTTTLSFLVGKSTICSRIVVVYYVKDGLTKYRWVLVALYAEGRPVSVWAVNLATNNQCNSFGLPLQSVELFLGRWQIRAVHLFGARWGWGVGGGGTIVCCNG